MMFILLYFANGNWLKFGKTVAKAKITAFLTIYDRCE